MEMIINKLTYGPDAIGRIDGVTVFVPGAIPGDKIDVKITKKSKNFWRGEVLKFIDRSERYVKAPCPYFNRCGGCQWQNLSYADQLDSKLTILSETLVHLGGLKDFRVSPIIGCKYPFGYRNKVQQPLAETKGGVVSGFYERGTHKIVPVEKCMLEMESAGRILVAAREMIGKLKLKVYDEKTGEGLLRHLIVRSSRSEGASVLTVVATRRFAEEKQLAFGLMKKLPDLKGVAVNINDRRNNVILGKEFFCIDGEISITESIGGLKFMVSPGSFFQTNSVQAEELCRVVDSLAGLEGGETVLDLYSGVGMIGMYLAGKAGKVSFVEDNPGAVSDAIRNAGLNGIENAQFFEGMAEEVLKKSRFLKKSDIIILDPPRQGVKEGILKQVSSSQASKIIYVSCDPGTFCRDLKQLESAGFKLETLVPVDMFPQTYHIEIVGRFIRENAIL